MTYEERQAQLLDDYLTALQHDPDAQAPDDLDPEMADFARMIAGGHDAISGETGAKGRIWENIQAEQKTIQPDFDERDHYMKNLKEKNKRSKRSRGWLPLVATAAISVLVTFILASVIFRSDSNLFAMFVRPDNTTIELPVTSIPVIATPINPSAIPMMASSQAVTGFPPTVRPPTTIDPFMMTATALVQNATQEVSAQLTAFVVSATPSPTFTSTPVPTATAIGASSTTIDPMLECNFDGEFDFRIDRNVVSDIEQLRITGTPLNTSTERVIFEIFGGFATNDEFLELESVDNPVLGIATTIGIPGDGFENGSYLVRVRLLDADDETLSSCGLPVTFTN